MTALDYLIFAGLFAVILAFLLMASFTLRGRICPVCGRRGRAENVCEDCGCPL